jgi:hypothetical protein
MEPWRENPSNLFLWKNLPNTKESSNTNPNPDLILDILKEGPNLTKAISISLPAYEFLEKKLLPVLSQFIVPAKQYCVSRNAGNDILRLAEETTRTQLNLFCADKEGISFGLWSSYPYMHLLNTSDIDFALLVEDLTQEKINIYGKNLEDSGFQFGEKINGYFIYRKKIYGIDIEVKLRDHSQSVRIQALHQHLNQLAYNTQCLLTYAKAVAFSDPNLYSKLKKIIYSAYYTQINM